MSMGQQAWKCKVRKQTLEHAHTLNHIDCYGPFIFVVPVSDDRFTCSHVSYRHRCHAFKIPCHKVTSTSEGIISNIPYDQN